MIGHLLHLSSSGAVKRAPVSDPLSPSLQQLERLLIIASSSPSSDIARGAAGYTVHPFARCPWMQCTRFYQTLAGAARQQNDNAFRRPFSRLRPLGPQKSEVRHPIQYAFRAATQERSLRRSTFQIIPSTSKPLFLQLTTKNVSDGGTAQRIVLYLHYYTSQSLRTPVAVRWCSTIQLLLRLCTSRFTAL